MEWHGCIRFATPTRHSAILCVCNNIDFHLVQGYLAYDKKTLPLARALL